MKVSIPELKTFIAATHTGKSGSENFFHLQPPDFNNQMTIEQIQGFQNEEQEINIIPVAGKVIISYYYNQKNHHSGSHISGKIQFPFSGWPVIFLADHNPAFVKLYNNVVSIYCAGYT